MIGRRSEAEDAVAEAYARAWQRWPTVSRANSPEAWVRRVGSRIAISGWRKTANRLRARHREAVDRPLDGLNPDHMALMQALGTIPSAQRRDIVLHSLGGRHRPRHGKSPPAPSRPACRGAGRPWPRCSTTKIRGVCAVNTQLDFEQRLSAVMKDSGPALRPAPVKAVIQSSGRGAGVNRPLSEALWPVLALAGVDGGLMLHPAPPPSDGYLPAPRRLRRGHPHHRPVFRRHRGGTGRDHH
ncbi:sigma factor [Micromonospora sp. CA-240977]|uniref:sigma factor n=1 Tax=Micromonospora sp. CA-240977 TaxID=3239957 RepID=UPI003D906F3E